jgi:hypothetical protein
MLTVLFASFSVTPESTTVGEQVDTVNTYVGSQESVTSFIGERVLPFWPRDSQRDCDLRDCGT